MSTGPATTTDSMLIEQVRHGQLLIPATLDSPVRVVQIAEIYPYHMCVYPDKDDLEATLSIWSGRDKYKFLLHRVLSDLEAHVSKRFHLPSSTLL